MVGSYSPHIVLFCDLDCLTLEIIKELQASSCQVTVIGRNISEAKKVLLAHGLSSGVNVLSRQQVLSIRKIDYFIYLFLEAG